MKNRAWNLARRLSSRSLLALGLTSIVICALLIADVLGLVPDRAHAVREGRVALAESVALSTAVLAVRGDADGLARYAGALESRQSALMGIRITSADASFAVQAGAVPVGAIPAAAGQSMFSDERVVVPVLGPDGAWGQVELYFKPVSWMASHLPWFPHSAPLALVLGVLCSIAFALYLRRMLRHLDPSNAIPARVRTAFDTLAEGLLVLDPAGDIVLANTAFAKVAGIEPDALIGRSAGSLPWVSRDASAPTTPRLPWLDALSDGRLRYGQLMVLPDAQGTLHTFMVNCSPIPGAATRPAGVLVSLDDVTELEEKEVQLRQARDAAQAADRAKSEFLANMSHEIRTPMNAILGFTELLRRGQGLGADDAQRHLATIHSSGRHLLELINDILDLSKIEAGRLEVERVSCEVHQVVAEVVRVMTVKADEKGIGLRLEVLSALPRRIHSDPSRIRQIITNLVGNAIKFTARGEVRVTLRLLGDPASSSSGGVVQIDVIDSGIGIASDRLESIFEPFVQAESSTTRQYGGTGLGLTISRRFARALGGDVRATSVPGQGSCFHVTLDTGALAEAAWLAPAEVLALMQAAPDDAATQPRWAFPPKRVLVVDDGAENRELVRLVLEEVGLEVVEAEHGAAAVQAVASQAPDLILMDIHMPVMDGPTATRQLRSGGFRNPIWALTANAMKGYERELADHGFDGYLTKPLDIDGLLARLAAVLQGRRADLPQPAAVDLPTEPVVELPTGPIVSRLAGHPRLAKVARSFCDQLPGKLDAMEAALAAGDFDTLKSLAHWLKGSGGSVGYDDLFEPARDLEKAAIDRDASTAGRFMTILRSLQARIEPPALPPAPASNTQSPPAAAPSSGAAALAS
jgi:PAS domain S-box-containing protein